jgi:hypothetical protein
MKTYARIEDGIVVEIIPPATWPDGSEIPIEQRFTAQFVATLVDISEYDPQPQWSWLAIEQGGIWMFSPPASP